MSQTGKSITILMADDDPDDRAMAREAMEEARLAVPFETVGDGEELMDYLRRQGEYSYLDGAPLPGLILLDLNMPRKDGREALKEIKADPSLRKIPIVVLTTSKEEEDVCRTYELGVSSFIVKPVTFEGMVDVMTQQVQELQEKDKALEEEDKKINDSLLDLKIYDGKSEQIFQNIDQTLRDIKDELKEQRQSRDGRSR